MAEIWLIIGLRTGMIDNRLTLGISTESDAGYSLAHAVLRCENALDMLVHGA